VNCTAEAIGPDVVGRSQPEGEPLKRHLAPRVSLFVLTSVVAVFLATASVPTPLYAVYSREWHLTAATTSLVFGMYALALLAALLVCGRISDHLGRRPVLLAALAVQVVAMIVFAGAGGLTALLTGRVLQGLSTGLGVSAVAAALTDIDEEVGTTANAVAPAVGSGVGALGAAIVVEFVPAAVPVIYIGFAVLLLAQVVLLFGVPESSTRRPGALKSLRPVVRVPASLRVELLAAALVVFAIWAFSGLFGSLGPRLVEEMSGSTSAIYGALPLIIFSVLAPVTGYFTRAIAPRRALGLGIGALVCGAGLIIVAVATASGYVLLASALVAGISFGVGFRGGLALVISNTPSTQRAGTPLHPLHRLLPRFRCTGNRCRSARRPHRKSRRDGSRLRRRAHRAGRNRRFRARSHHSERG